MEEVRKRPFLSELIKQKRFDRYVILEHQEHAGRIREILDENGATVIDGELLCT